MMQPNRMPAYSPRATQSMKQRHKHHRVMNGSSPTIGANRRRRRRNSCCCRFIKRAILTVIVLLLPAIATFQIMIIESMEDPTSSSSSSRSAMTNDFLSASENTLRSLLIHDKRENGIDIGKNITDISSAKANALKQLLRRQQQNRDKTPRHGVKGPSTKELQAGHGFQGNQILDFLKEKHIFG